MKNKTENIRLVNHIKQHRARLNLTQQALAEQVGVSRQTILSIEKGLYIPSALLAFRIAETLGMRANELFELKRGEE
jgi:putative transcriptional regulator